MTTRAIWDETISSRKEFPPLSKNYSVDILIIGGGITGLTTAYRLINEGKSVAIIEANRIASGTTGHSTANLYLPIQPSYTNVYKMHGKETAIKIAQSRRSAMNFIEEITQNHNIDCHFSHRPFYYYTDNNAYIKKVNNEYETLIKLGIECELTTNLPSNLNSVCAFKIEKQSRFNPTLYLLALADYLYAKGCAIFEHSPINNYEENADHCIIKTSHGKITANKMVIATHIPLGIHKTQFLAYPYRSYAVAIPLKGVETINGNFWRIGAETFAISTHNVFEKNRDTLIVAGSHHKTGQAENDNHEIHFSKIKRYITQHFPTAVFENQWSAQHYQSADGLPYIGLATRKSKRLFIATGYSSDGLIYGTVAGLLLSDLIQEAQNSWTKIYSPNRLKYVASFKRYVKENFNVFVQYMRGLFTKSSGKTTDNIKSAESKIILLEGKKCAVYRDEQGQLYKVSAVCTHMKGIVKWNDVEKTWDCPCHGSRFSITGEVLEGPALTPLKKID